MCIHRFRFFTSARHISLALSKERAARDVYWEGKKWHCHVSTTKWKQCELKSKRYWFHMVSYEMAHFSSSIHSHTHTHIVRAKKENDISTNSWCKRIRTSQIYCTLGHVKAITVYIVTFLLTTWDTHAHTYDRHTLWFCGCLGSFLFYRWPHCSVH